MSSQVLFARHEYRTFTNDRKSQVLIVRLQYVSDWLIAQNKFYHSTGCSTVPYTMVQRRQYSTGVILEISAFSHGHGERADLTG
eukprot:COSAG02_NODE_134_length_34593_cov_43.594886_18_plen_84_part_00